MCGIVGYIGKRKAWPVLFKGLERLEYRGYDSAGIALLQNGAFSVYKKKGRVVELSKFTKNQNQLSGGVGIAHTRWATHGVPSDRNAPPHFSSGGGIGIGKKEFFVASDATPIIEHTKKVIYLEDGQMATIKNSKLLIKTIKNKTIKNPYVHTLKTKIEELEKGGFPLFMLKEIFEQPKSLADTMRGRIVLDKGNVKFGGLEKFEKQL